jgi:hypothetical protein
MGLQRIPGPVFAWVSGPGEVDPGYGVDIPGRPDQGLPGGGGGGRPSHPIVLPPLPPDLKPDHPIYLPPPGAPEQPIFLPVEPEHPIQLPPGQIWPPLPPSAGVGGKVVILVWVVGVGYRWFYLDAPVIYPPQPPQPTPKPV